MVGGTDDPNDGPGHQVHSPRVGELHQLSERNMTVSVMTVSVSASGLLVPVKVSKEIEY